MIINLPNTLTKVKVKDIKAANQFKSQRVSLIISSEANSDAFIMKDGETVEVEHINSFNVSTLGLLSLLLESLFGSKEIDLLEK